jgi:hypothetical protein
MSESAQAGGAANTGAQGQAQGTANTQTTTGQASTQTGTTGGTDWTASLNEDLRGYVATKGFKDPAAAIESYRNFERLHGVPADRLLKLPENLDSPEGRAIWEKLGRPKDAKDYSINIPDSLGDKELADWIRTVADSGNYTQKQVDTLVKGFNDRTEGMIKAATDKAQAEFQVQEANLKRDWGQAFDQNVNLAKQACNNLGITKDHVDALEDSLGYEGTMKLLQKLGGATGEAPFVSGQSAGGGVMAADQAKARINELMRDPAFGRRYASGDADARRQMENLHKMAHPGMTSL